MTAQLLGQMVTNSMSVSLIYILIALGLTLMFGIMHIVNFAHGEIYMLGAFGIYYLNVLAGIPYPLALIISVILLAGFGAALNALFFRVLAGQFLPSLILSLGLVLILQNVGWLVFGAEAQGVPKIVQGVLSFGGISLPVDRIVVMLAAIALMIGMYFFVHSTRTGRAMRAVEEDPTAASLHGVNVSRIHYLTWIIGCALAAAAGGLVAPLWFLDPVMGAHPALNAFVIIVIGGLGSVPGAIVGGFLFGFIETFGGTLVGPEITSMILFAILIVFIIFKPTGLMGVPIR